jgi:hypothetical protein
MRTGHVFPPVGDVLEAHRPLRLAKDQGAGDEQLRVGVRVLRGVELALGDRDVLRLTHEAAELGGGHRPLVDPEPVDLDAADRRLFGVEALVAHVERAAGDEDHPLRRLGR